MTNNNTPYDGAPSGDTPTIESREIVDDSVSISAPGAEWNRTEYTDKTGQRRIRLTKR